MLGIMSVTGFIILRHVTSQITDQYWKECYHRIRQCHPDAPILIVDDSSDRTFLSEDIPTVHCTTVYDTEHKSRGELLPYYYFHSLHPFDCAIILHDSVFLQHEMNGLLDTEDIRFLWTFRHIFDYDILPQITTLYTELDDCENLARLYENKNKWHGCFGGMSIIRWTFMDKIVVRHQIFDRWLPLITCRDMRSALERAFALVAHIESRGLIKTELGDIHTYCPWGVTFLAYQSGELYAYPVAKVWTGR